MYGSKYILVCISRCVYEEYIHVNDSQSGMILPPRGHLVISGFIFWLSHCRGGELLVSSQRPVTYQMLLTSRNATTHNKEFSCTEQNANSAELGKHWFVCVRGGEGGDGDFHKTLIKLAKTKESITLHAILCFMS